MQKNIIHRAVTTAFLFSFFTGMYVGVLYLQDNICLFANVYGIPTAEAQTVQEIQILGPACRPTRLVKPVTPPPAPVPAPAPAPAPAPQPPPSRPRRSRPPVYIPPPEVAVEEPVQPVEPTEEPVEPEEPEGPATTAAFLLQDSDSDGFTDMTEQSAGTDPQDADSHLPDTNNNGTDDAWEARFGITQSGKDADGDGLYDALEYTYDLDPLQTDTDGDGFSDADEVLSFRTDPKNAADPGTFEALGLRITSFDEGQTIDDNQPLVKGIGPPLSMVEILLRRGDEETVLGKTQVAENGIFLFQVTSPIQDGDYEFMVRLAAADIGFIPRRANAQAVETDDPSSVKVTINTTLDVEPPQPTKLGGQDLDVGFLAENLRVEIRDQKPVLVGKSFFRTKVVANWRSVVLTSALIADNVAGEFEIQAAQAFEVGEHEVYVQAVRPKDNAMSKTVKIPFVIVAQAATEPAEQVLAQTDVLPWIIGGALAVIAIAMVLAVVRKKKLPQKPNPPAL